ncbi:MAG: HEAT repeat domain-containing protein, partial [Planctomycetes bacterium]|nr:HEAT repeat domain-containing protein [Planctomycetota bacterium]
MRHRVVLSVLILATLAVPASSGPPAAPPELEGFKKELKHFDLKIRLAAVGKVEALGGPLAATVLLTALDDEEWEVRIRILEALGRLKEPETAEALARAAVDGEIILVRAAAVRALRDLGQTDTAKRILRGAAAAKKPEVKVRALDAAGALAQPADATDVFPFLMNRETAVRAAACRALGGTKSPAALPYLSKMVREKEPAVTAAAIEALGMIGGGEALDSLLECALTAEDPYFVERIARAYRAIGTALSAPFLAGKAAEEKKADRRAKIVRVLSGLEETAAGESLAGFLADPDPTVRAWTARGVGRAAHAGAAEALERLMDSDPDGTVRRMALEARFAVAPEKEGRAAVLVKALRNDRPEIRIRASVLAARERCLPAVPALAPLMDAGDWRESTAAIIAVGILGHAGEVELV